MLETGHVCVLLWGESQRDIEMCKEVLEQVCAPFYLILAILDTLTHAMFGRSEPAGTQDSRDYL